MRDEPLKGGTILITGASSGIGRAAALRLAREGAAVALVARRAQLLDDLAEEIEAAGGKALPLAGDATDERFVRAAVDAAADWGRARDGGLDTVIANAAMGLTGGVEHFAYDEFLAMTHLNLGGPFLLARAAIPHLRARGRGSILAVGSELSRGAMAGLAPYGMTKWGLLGFMRALALELRPLNVRVSTVLPGGVLTDFGPDDTADKEERRARGERFLAPEDVAEAILFLLTRPDGTWTPELDLYPV